MTMSIEKLCHHFGLHTPPFERPVPQAGLLRHRTFTEAITRIQLGIESRTPVLFTAEPGLGKSTLLGVVNDSVDTSKTHVIYTPLCSCGPFGLVGQMATHYGLKPKRSASQTAQTLLDELSRTGKREVWILDEAHRLPASSLDELRLLNNSDFDRAAPFCLVLCGQPPLRKTLSAVEHDSLWQRLAIRTSLSPLSDEETSDYVDRRLRAAGASSTLFRPAAINKLFEHSRGVPRMINNLCTAALFAAAAASRKHVDAKDVEAAQFDLEHS
jgi:type II secretory pathway predicted ATPase ExeA